MLSAETISKKKKIIIKIYHLLTKVRQLHHKYENMCPILTVLLLILFVQGYKPQWLTAPSNGRGKGLRGMT